MQGAIAHVGRYTVNDKDHSITFHIEHSSFPNWNGTEQKRAFSITGDQLKYKVLTPSTGSGTAEVVLKRVK